MQETVKLVIKKIKSSGKILLLSHVMPDGDNIGSLLGLYNSLKATGYNVTAANHDPVPRSFSYLPNSDKIKKLADINEKYDLLVVLDSSSVERTGAKDLAQYSDFVIDIDHHVSNDNFGALNIVYTDYSSTVQIVYELIKKARLRLDADVAACLYCGLMTDTVGFQTAATNESVFKMAAHLVALGASPNVTSREIFQNKSLASVIISGKTLSSMNFMNDGMICWSKVEQKTIKEANGTPGDSFGVVNQMLGIRGVEVAVVFHEQSENKVILDFRSKSIIDVNKVATHFGGGGHLRASGATVVGELNKVISEVMNFITDYIKTNYQVKETKGKSSIESISSGKPKSAKTPAVGESLGI